ncbi:ATP synthase subunit I [Inhella gelatinilytica]|uniref:ATP synthase subunit I n=1 Tax=Inhella gelatinilytica TaxID=2795030 RepID=A0A931IT19_9BURK|nr:ATP synthase subunit I [Inhella gelatinilytica]MBH9551619.1 ATP synthase subunit I [Inhella gelatinilytica]
MTEPNRSAGDPWSEEEAQSQPVAPWTREQVQALESRQPGLSPWRVVMVQALVGAVLSGLWALLGSAPRPQAVSAMWGAAAVVLPSALMAWGLRRRGVQPTAALLAFAVWELVKVLLTVAILVAAVKTLPALSWPALLVSLIGCLKVHVWGLWALRKSN